MLTRHCGDVHFVTAAIQAAFTPVTVFIQAAFNPAATNSNSKAATDWGAVKLEDKYLMHQVS